MRNVVTTFRPWSEYKTYKGFEVEWLMTLIGEGYDETISDWEIECAEDFRDILRYSKGHSTLREKNFYTHSGYDTEWLDTLLEEGFDSTISEEEIEAAFSWKKIRTYSKHLDEKKHDKPDTSLIQHAKHLYKKHNGDVEKIRNEYPKKVKKSGYYDNHAKRPVKTKHGESQRKSNTISFHVGDTNSKTSDHKLHIYDSEGEKRSYVTTHDSEKEHTEARKTRSDKL